MTLLLALGLLAAEPTPIAVNVPKREAPVSFAKEVADVLGGKCVGCHGGALKESKLNLEDVAGMLKGGKRGPAIVPGKADESLLFRMAAHRIEPVMPPADKKEAKPLTPDELGLLKLWIDAGAKDDSAEVEATPIELGSLPPGVQPIVAVDLTLDGKRIAAGRGNIVHVYDADSGLEIAALDGHRDIVQSIRFSPDGKRLAAGSYQVVTLWDMPTGGLSKTLAGHGDQATSLAVADDGNTIVSASLDRTIRFWNAAAGTEVRRIDHPAAPIHVLALSADGQKVVTGGVDGIVRVLNLADGKELFALKGHGGPVLGVAFVGGKSVASASADGTARVWTLSEAPNVEPIVLNGHAGPVHALAVTPDGRHVITGGEDKTIRVWNAADGKAGLVMNLHAGPVVTLAISPKGDLVLSGSADKSAQLIRIADGSLVHTLGGHGGPVRGVAFTADGARVVTGGAEGGVKVWDAASGKGIIAFGHPPPDGQATQPVLAVAALGAGGVVSASADRTIKTWTFEGTWAERKPLGPHSDRVLALDFNADGTLLAAGGGEPSRSGQVRVWEVGKGLPVFTLDGLHSDTVFGLRFSPDGQKLATCAADKFVKVVNVADGTEIRSFEGHTHHVLGVDWKSDGKQLVSGGADNVLKVWDFDAGEQLRTLQAAGKQVTAVRWLAGKASVAGASGDKVVRFWNADNGGVERNFGGPGDFVFGVAVSADGGRVAAGGADGVLHLWRGDNAQVIRTIPAGP